MEDGAVHTEQMLEEVPPEQRQWMRALAEQNRPLFLQVLLKARKYQRIRETGNVSAWKIIQREEKELLNKVLTTT